MVCHLHVQLHLCSMMQFKKMLQHLLKVNVEIKKVLLVLTTIKKTGLMKQTAKITMR